MHTSPRAWLLGKLFAIGAVVTLLVLPAGGTPVSDVRYRLGVAHSLWTGKPPLEGLPTTDPFVLRDRQGRPTPWFGIGQSLVLMPGDILATAVGAHTPRARFFVVEYLTFPIVNGLVIAAAAALLLAAGFSAYAAVAGALSLMLGSTVLWHFQNNQENPLQFLLVLTALTCAFHWINGGGRRWLMAMGACLGFDLLIRLPNAVDVLLVSAIPLFSARWRTYLRDGLLFAAPGIAAGLLGDRLYHFWRFGEWTSNYMAMSGELARQLALPVPEGFPFSNAFWVGMTGPFVSLHKSMFLFDPLLLIALVAAVSNWRRLRSPIRLLAIATVAGVLMMAAGYARYYNWSGISGWGDRFLTTWVWVGCLLAVPMLIESGVRRRAIAALAAIAMSLQLCSIVFPSWLEEMQLATEDVVVEGVITVPDGRFDHFIIGQRIRNIVAAALGDNTFHAPIVPILMPLRTLPPWAALLARLALLSAMLWVAISSVRLIRSARSAHQAR